MSFWLVVGVVLDFVVIIESLETGVIVLFGLLFFEFQGLVELVERRVRIVGVVVGVGRGIAVDDDGRK